MRIDQPFIHCKLRPGVGFARIDPFLLQHEQLLDADKWDEADALWFQFAGGLRLLPDDSPTQAITNFLLRIDGDMVRFRY